MSRDVGTNNGARCKQVTSARNSKTPKSTEMPVKRCAWGRCNSDTRYKDAPHMEGVSFMPFPKPKTNLEKCLLWIKLCGRPTDQLHPSLIKRHTHYVCSKHFLHGCVDPVPACPYGKTTPSRKRPADRGDSILLPLKSASSKRKIIRLESEEVPVKEEIILSIPIPDTVPVDISNSPNEANSSIDINNNDKSTQTLNSNTFVETVLSTDKLCFFYTGVPTVDLLKFMYDWIAPAAQHTKLWDGKRRHIPGRKGGKRRSKYFHEFLVCLVKIRQGYGFLHLSYLFGISNSQVCRIFTTWVNLLNQCLKPLLIWPSKEIVKANIPASFSQYPNTRAVIDCTEYYVQKPIKPVAQKLTWSNYKHSNTFKQLVAISPNGTITFVSNLYSGSISDASIVKESNFVNLIEQGDDIMADRGFNIRHLLLPKRATLNIPAFSHGKQLSKKAVKKSRKIASVRIHVERAIRRMKTFKVLSGIIPIKLRYLLNQITLIVAVLCNLQPCLA